MWVKQHVRNARTAWIGDYIDSYKDVELLFSDTSKQYVTLAPDTGTNHLTPVTTTSVKMTILSVYDEGSSANQHVWRIKVLRFYNHSNAVPFSSETYEVQSTSNAMCSNCLKPIKT